MNLFEDFGSSQTDFIQSTFSNVFQNFATDTLQRNGLIKSGTPPLGNPLPNQTGAPTPIFAANTAGLDRSKSFGLMGMDSTTTMLLIGGVALVVVLLVMKK